VCICGMQVAALQLRFVSLSFRPRRLVAGKFAYGVAGIWIV